MAQYTNPYGQQYYGASGSNPYATTGIPTNGVSGYSNQYLNPQTAQYSNAYPAQYSQYQNVYQQAYQPQVPQVQAYASYSAHQAPPQVPAQIPRFSAAQGEGSNSVWMGDIDPWMDENFIYSLFAHTGEVLNVKLIRDKQTGMPANYCFVYFATQLAAQKVIENFNGQPIPGTSKVFRLNFAQYGMGDKGKKTTSAEPRASGPSSSSKPVAMPRPSGEDVISLFIGDLAPDVTDYYILTTFQYYYPSVYSAKVVTDPKTGLSKGYGFVYFTDENEKIRALNEMQGYYLSYRPIRLNLATKKGESKPPQYVPGAMQPNYPSSNSQPPYSAATLSNPQGPSPRSQSQDSTTLGPADPNNTTVFVGGIDSSVTHEMLKSFFQQYGEINQVKIPFGKGCAFIEFYTHESAGRVLNTLNGTAIIGNSQVRLSWGRPSTRSAPQSHQVTLPPSLAPQTPSRPQITSQTSANAAALLSQQVPKTNQSAEKEPVHDDYAHSSDSYSDQGYSYGDYQSEYGQEYDQSEPQYTHADGEGLRLVTNEDVNQAPPIEEQVEGENAKAEEGEPARGSEEVSEKKTGSKRPLEEATEESSEAATQPEESRDEEESKEEKTQTSSTASSEEEEEQQPVKRQKTGDEPNE